MTIAVFTIGGEAQVNATATSDQMYPAVSALAGGGWIVTWASLTQDGGGFGIYQRRYDAQGATTGPDVLVNATTADNQTYPSVTGLANGGWVVTWQSNLQDGAKYGVYQRVYDAQGATTGADILVNVTTADDQQSPSVTALKNGGWVVTWQSNLQDGSSNGVYQRIYNAQGVTAGPDILVNLTTASDQSNPSVTALSDGGWVVSWQSNLQDGSGYGIYQRRYDAQGATTGPDVLVNATTNLSQNSPSLAALANGGWVVTWQSNIQDGSGYGVYQRVYDAQGATTGADILVNVTTASDQQGPSVTALKNGGWVVTWQSNLQDGSGYGVYQRHYTDSGATVGPDILVNTVTGSDQQSPSVTATSDGGWTVAWMSHLQDGTGWGIFQRHYTPAGGSTLTAGADIAMGTSANETLYVLAGSLNAGDLLSGGAGADTLEMVTAGTIDLTAPAQLSGFEALAGSAGNDTIVVNAARLGAFTSFEGRAGVDILQFMGAGSFDCRGKTFSGIEKIVLTGGGAAVTVGDVATALLLRGSVEDHNSVTLVGGVFTSVERQQLFRQGMETVADDGGTYANQPPGLSGLDGDSVIVADGETVLIDAGGDATVVDNAGSLRSLEVLVSRNGIASEDRFGISTGSGLSLSAGITSGSLISINGTVFGTITATGHALQVSFNDNATAALIQQLVRSLTYTNINEVDPSTSPRTISITLADGTGAWTTAATSVTVHQVNDAPALLGISASPQTVADDGLLAPFASASIGDLDSPSLTLTVTLDDPAKGTLLHSGSGSYDALTGTYTVTGSAAAVSAALQALQFDPRERFTLGEQETTTFTIRVSDGAHAPVLETATVTAVAANRAPTVISLDGTSIGEHAGLGAVIGTLGAMDPNGNQGFTYTLLDNAGGRFAIENGQLVVANPLLLEADRTETYQVGIQVTDAGGLSRHQTFGITVIAQNDAPTLSMPVGSVPVIPDTGTVYPFPGIAFGDKDSPALTVTVTLDDSTKGILTNPGPGIYDAASGTYTVTGSVDTVTAAVRGLCFEPRDRLDAAGTVEATTFTIRVDDGAGHVAMGTTSVKAVTTNYAPMAILLDGAAVDELAANGTVVGTLGALDPNGPEGISYTLTDDAGGRFAIENGRLVVKDGVKLDFEQAVQHQVTIRASDPGHLSIERTFTIAVGDVSAEATGGSANVDVLVGGAERDRLSGGEGNDILTGGAGQDVFVFDTKLGTSKTNRQVNFDTITDFKAGQDKIWLEDAVFKKLGKGTELKPGKLKKDFFVVGTKAKDKNDYLIYNKKTGVLAYDADGSGKGKAVEFAQLAQNLKLTEKDFFVI